MQLATGRILDQQLNGVEAGSQSGVKFCCDTFRESKFFLG